MGFWPKPYKGEMKILCIYTRSPTRALGWKWRWYTSSWESSRAQRPRKWTNWNQTRFPSKYERQRLKTHKMRAVLVSKIKNDRFFPFEEASKKGFIGGVFYSNRGASCERPRNVVFSTESQSTNPYGAKKKNPRWFEVGIMKWEAIEFWEVGVGLVS